MKKKVLLRSPLLSISGYGSHAKLIFRSLRAFEDLVDLYIQPITWGATSWDHLDNEERRYIDSLVQKTIQYQQQGGQFDISCQCTIPTEFQQLAPINIGITAGIETTKIAPQWIEKSQLMNKLIFVSDHAKFGFENTTVQAQNRQTGEIIPDFKVNVAMTVIPYPIKPTNFTQEQVDKFKFETDFNFLTLSQWGPRKNLENTIKWFVETFYNDPNVGLVAKISIRNNSLMDRTACDHKLKTLLEEYKDKKCKIYLLHGFLDDDEMSALYNHPKVKAFLSLPHGEGFGLGMFEAAYNGMPVIAPNWGGQVDFLNAPIKDKKTKETINKPLFATVEYELKQIQKEAIWENVLIADSQWCFPIESSAKKRMRDVYSEYNRFKLQARGLQKYILENFKQDEIYKKYAEEILGEKITVVDLNLLPKVSVITSMFKSANYVDSLCKDVIRQSIFKDKIEWIIIHPKSSPDFEKEKEVILSYKEKYPSNIVYIEKEAEEDKGLYWAWNEGIKVATGEYITNWNTDDTRAINNIEKCAKELFIDGTADLIYYDQFITDKPNETFEVNSSNGRKYNFPHYTFESLKMINLNHSMAVWRKNLHDKFGYFEEKYKSAGDWDFALRIASQGAILKKIDDVLGLYFFSPVGISTNPENFSWKRIEEKEVYQKFKDVKVDK